MNDPKKKTNKQTSDYYSSSTETIETVCRNNTVYIYTYSSFCQHSKNEGCNHGPYRGKRPPDRFVEC